jgi:hypothetical protein
LLKKLYLLLGKNDLQNSPKKAYKAQQSSESAQNAIEIQNIGKTTN